MSIWYLVQVAFATVLIIFLLSLAIKTIQNILNTVIEKKLMHKTLIKFQKEAHDYSVKKMKEKISNEVDRENVWKK